MALKGKFRHYTSNECQHKAHNQCVLKCLQCFAMCRCKCHSPK